MTNDKKDNDKDRKLNKRHKQTNNGDHSRDQKQDLNQNNAQKSRTSTENSKWDINYEKDRDQSRGLNQDVSQNNISRNHDNHAKSRPSARRQDKASKTIQRQYKGKTGRDETRQLNLTQHNITRTQVKIIQSHDKTTLHIARQDKGQDKNRGKQRHAKHCEKTPQEQNK